MRLVGPPSSQCRRWWASHQVAGVVQRGKVQCRSRSHRARGLGGGEVPLVSSPVQDVPVGGADDRDDGAVAGQPPDGLGAEEGAGVDAADQDTGPGPVLQVVQADGDQHGGLDPGRPGGGESRAGVGGGQRRG